MRWDVIFQTIAFCSKIVVKDEYFFNYFLMLLFSNKLLHKISATNFRWTSDFEVEMPVLRDFIQPQYSLPQYKGKKED